MSTILVGVDGSGSAAHALNWAVGAARATDAELAVVAATSTEGEDRAEVEKLLDTDWTEPVRQANLAYRTSVLAGDARLALGDAAAAEDAALVVVGAGHERWFPALHLGSVSHYLAHHLARPLCVVPIARDGFDASGIVVGVDGSPGSAAAARWCAEFALAAGGAVTAVHAWHHFAPLAAVTASARSQAEAEQSCRQWAEAPAEAGVLAGVRVTELDAVRALAQAVTETGSGVLALGTRGAGGFKGLHLGSVALRVLQTGCAPTVLIPFAA